MAQKVSRRTIARTVVSRLIAEPQKQAYWIQSLGAYLVEHNLTKQADLILKDIVSELYIQAGELSVDVVSARPLTDQIRMQLTQYLTDRTSAQSVQMQESVDPNLLGGLIASTPDFEIDMSVRKQLNQLSAIA